MPDQDAEQEAIAGFSIAAFTISIASLATAVREGRITMAESAAIIGQAHVSLKKLAPSWPGSPMAVQRAEDFLRAAAGIVATASAEKSPRGAN